jgi:hypothetical protein
MTQGDIEFELEVDPDSKSVTWLLSEISPNFSTSVPATTSGSVTSPVSGFLVLERPSAVSDANPGAKNEGVATVESGGWLDNDGSHRVHHEIFGKIPYLARQLSVF